MADNVVLNAGSGGTTVRAKQIGTVDTQIVQLDVGGQSAESLVSTANPLPVIQPHDVIASRTPITIYLDAVAGITTEALATMNINKAGTVTTGTSYTVTAGKTLKVIFFGSSVKNTSTVCSNSRMRLRSAATVAATSPIYIANEVGSLYAVANSTNTDDTDIGEGIMLAAGVQIGVSHIESATTCTVSCCLIGFEY